MKTLFHSDLRKSVAAIIVIAIMVQSTLGTYITGYKCNTNVGALTYGCEPADCPIGTTVPCPCSKITFAPAVNVCVTAANYSCDPGNCTPVGSFYEIYSGTCYFDANGNRYCKWDGSPKDNGHGNFCCAGYSGGS